MLQQEPLGGEPSGNIPSQPVFAARLRPQCLAMTSLTQSAWNKRTMHSGLEEFSLFECIIVLIGQWTPCKIMEKPLWKVWNTFLLPALARIIADFISKCSWGFECSVCFRRNHPCVNDFLLIPILALLHISWYELIPRRWARIRVFLGQKKTIPSHQQSPCHECSCGAQRGSLFEGSVCSSRIVPGEEHPRLQPRGELSLRSPGLLSIPTWEGVATAYKESLYETIQVTLGWGKLGK